MEETRRQSISNSLFFFSPPPQNSRVFGGLSCWARVLKEPLRRHGASSSATELLSLGTSAAGSVAGGFGLSSVKLQLKSFTKPTDD